MQSTRSSKKLQLNKRAELNFDAIGSPWRIDSARPFDESLKRTIAETIERFDVAWSRFRDDSLVAKMSREPGVWRFPPEGAQLFDVYRHLYEATDGRLNPLVGQALVHLGYDATYSLRDSGRREAVPAWEDAIAWDGEALTTLRGVTLDVGAAGKGLLVDLVAGDIQAAGFDDFVVDASGDIVHCGPTPTRVGLENPFDASKVIGIAHLRGGALCASATNRRAWGDGLHHVVDATTGLPTRDVVATWVLAPTGLLADGLATGLFFASADAFSALGPFSWVRMFASGRVEHSADFDGELFT